MGLPTAKRLMGINGMDLVTAKRSERLINGHVYVERKGVEHVIQATFPEYKGRKVALKAVEKVVVNGLNWDGGSRSCYVGCTLDGKRTGDASIGNAAAPWANPIEGKEVTVPAGYALVEHSYFCGKNMGLMVYLNPADMPRYLPESTEELSVEEKNLLRIMRTYKAAYRREKWSQLGYGGLEYTTVLEGLKVKGYITAVGGLSLKGKNAAGNL